MITVLYAGRQTTLAKVAGGGACVNGYSRSSDRVAKVDKCLPSGTLRLGGAGTRMFAAQNSPEDFLKMAPALLGQTHGNHGNVRNQSIKQMMRPAAVTMIQFACGSPETQYPRSWGYAATVFRQEWSEVQKVICLVIYETLH